MRKIYEKGNHVHPRQWIIAIRDKNCTRSKMGTYLEAELPMIINNDLSFSADGTVKMDSAWLLNLGLLKK